MITTRILVDFALPNRSVYVEAMQGDGATRTVAVMLRANGLRWEPPAGVDAALAYRQPDGHKGFYDKLADGSPAITVSGNVASVVLIPQMLAVPGEVQCQLVFNDSKLDRLTSFPFVLKVAKNDLAGVAPVQDYIRLQWLEDRLDEVLRKAADSGAFRGEPGEPGPQGEAGVSTIVNGKAPDEAGNVTLSAADVGALPSSGGDMTGAINMNGQPVSGLNQPTEDTQAANKGYVDAAKAEAISHANAAARAAAPRNLLDNSDFRNPVNQRGQTSYSNNFIYTIDRWQTGDNGTTIQLQSDGVELHSSDGSSYPYIFQKVEKLRAGTYTCAAKFHGNTGIVALTSYATDNLGYIVPTSADENGVIILSFTITEEIDSSFAYFRVQLASAESSVVWDWAALYEGTYTAETLPEYRPKGYGAELAECQRYYYRTAFSTNNSFIGDTGAESKNPRFHIQTPVPIRIKNPTVNISAATSYIITNSETANIGKPAVASAVTNGNSVYVILAALASAVGSTAFALCAVQTACSISADL